MLEAVDVPGRPAFFRSSGLGACAEMWENAEGGAWTSPGGGGRGGGEDCGAGRLDHVALGDRAEGGAQRGRRRRRPTARSSEWGACAEM